MYVLDTNLVSEMRKAHTRAIHPKVKRWFGHVDSSLLYFSAITLQELETGVLLLARKDKAAAFVLEQWLHGLLIPSFQNRILPVDAAVARRCAALHVPRTQPHNDALIAATALVHGMTVVTRNVADFAPTGVPILNPWEF
jgi:predicted nucleic acid-binding protein